MIRLKHPISKKATRMTGLNVACRHCNVTLFKSELTHWSDGRSKDGYGHYGLCCECFDLSCGKPIELVNERRKKMGRPDVPEWTEE